MLKIKIHKILLLNNTMPDHARDKHISLFFWIIINKENFKLASSSSTMVKHSPHHPKVKGLSPVTVARRENDKMDLLLRNSQIGFSW
jgi:hypothetical protein